MCKARGSKTLYDHVSDVMMEERSSSDARKGSYSKECEQPLQSEKGLEMDVPLRIFRRNQTCQYFRLSPIRLTLDF